MITESRESVNVNEQLLQDKMMRIACEIFLQINEEPMQRKIERDIHPLLAQSQLFYTGAHTRIAKRQQTHPEAQLRLTQYRPMKVAVKDQDWHDWKS